MTEVYDNSHILESGDLIFNKPAHSAYNDEHFSAFVKSSLTNTANSDEFYKKLIELKNEQKKQLLFMEDLYNQKQILKEEILKSENNLDEIKATKYPIAKSENYKLNINTISAYENKPYSLIEDEINYLTKTQNSKIQSKPPLPQKTSTVTFQNTITVPSSNNNYQENESEFKKLDLLSDDLKQIEKIWEEFRFDDVNKKSLDFNRKFEKRIHKVENRKASLKKRPASVQVEWYPRVTIPEPFSMTIREQIKSEKKKKTSREMQDEREKRIEAELRECNRQFRANPVPAHVMVPLYEKLKQEEDLRKIKLKKMSQEYMEKVSKPFNLTDTKTKKSTRERRHSFSEGQNDKTEFVAQPLPEFYYDDEESIEKMKEIELYKQLKNQMRALELLKKSKLPTNMQLYEEKKKLEQERAKLFIKEINKLQKKIHANSSKKHSKSNKSIKKSHDVPDYDALYKKFIIELETKKVENRKEIQAEPFTLLTETRVRPKTNDEQANNTSLKRSSSMSRLNRSLSASIDAFPIKYNESHKLRESVNKEKMNEIVRKELQNEHIDKIKKLKEKKLHDQIQEKINYDPKEIEKNFQRKARRLRLEQKTKEEEYGKEIANIHQSIEGRKLQIEQVEEDNIRRALEKKYKEALRRAGINESEIMNKKSSVQVARSVVHDPVDDEWINN